jgi:hypothetical protein
MDVIVKYINEASVRGELAREFSGIISDYENGRITAKEKQDLIEAVVAGFKASQAAKDEETVKWVANASKIVGALI